MKNILLIFLMIFFALGAYAQEIIQVPSKGKEILKTQDDFSGFHAVFSFDEMRNTTVEDDEFGAFSQIAIDGAFPTGDVGTPALPVFKKMIAVPVGATPKVIVRNFAEQAVDLNERGVHRIFPVQPPVLQGEEEAQQPLVLNEIAYSENEFTRSSIANISVLGTMRGVRIAMLTVQPVRYNPVAGALLVYNDIDVEVIFENGDYAATQSLYQATYSPYFATPYSYFYNKGVYEEHPDLYKTPVHMLVVADRMFSAALQPWIAWKTKKGFYVEVGYTDEIGTTAAEIQTYCHQKYNAGVSAGKTPTFLVVVGDVEQVPASADGTATSHVTDLYYASVDGDYFPEMYYSRMSAQTEEQLENIIAKINRYEQQYDSMYTTGLGHSLLIAGIDGIWNNIMGRQQMRYLIYNYMQDEYGSSTAMDFSEPPYWNVYNYFSMNGFVNYAGHCEEEQWTFPEFPRSEVYTYEDDNNLSYIMMANCSLTANFEHDETIGEAFIRVKDKGASTYIGSAAPTFWNENFHFTVGAYAALGDQSVPSPENSTMGYYDAWFRDDAFNCVGGQVFAGNLAVTYAVENGYPIEDIAENNAQYYWEAYHVLGDASIMPYAILPEENVVSHEATIYIESQQFEVTADPGSLVALSQNETLIGTAVANENGVAVLPINTALSNNIDIVVTRRNRKPYISQITLSSTNEPYLVCDRHYVVGESGLTYRSQERDVAIVFQNIGGVPIAQDWEVTISCDDPQLTINRATVSYPPIAVNEKKTGIFNVSVAPDVEDGTTFLVKAVARAGQKSWNFEIPMTAYAPKFVLEKFMVGGVENAPIGPNDAFILTAVVRNIGGAKAYNVTANLTMDDDVFAIFCMEEDMKLGHINLNAAKSIDFSVESKSFPSPDYLPEIVLRINVEMITPFDLPLTLDNGVYALPGATNCVTDRFTYVKLEEIENHDNECRPDGYSDFTDMSATLYPETKYEIDMDATDYWDQAKIWIDWNGNQKFDEEELVFSGWPGQPTRTFTVPQTALVGTSRMRLRLRYERKPIGPYDNWERGQTHDYTIVIKEKYPFAQNVRAEATENSVMLTWEAPSSAAPEKYSIYKNNTLLKTVEASELFYEDSYLASGLYVYTVEAVFSGNKKARKIYANPICISGYEYACEPPVMISAEANQDNQTVTITWQEPEYVDDLLLGYNLYRNGHKVQSSTITGTTYIDRNLKPMQYGYYVAAVYKNCSESMPSEIVYAEIEEVGVDDIASANFEIFPNPARNQVTVKGEGLVKIEIFDLQGRKIQTCENLKDEVVINDLYRYANGIYLIRMYHRTAVPVTKKLILIK